MLWLRSFRRYSYITILINIYAFLKLTPYYIIWDLVDESLIAQTSYFQQVCCAGLQIIDACLSMMWVAEALKQLQEGEQQNLSLVFDLVQRIASTALYFYMTNFLWRRQRFFIKLVNETYPFTITTSKCQYLVMFLLFVVHLVVYRLLGAPLFAAKARTESILTFAYKILQDFGITLEMSVFLYHEMEFVIKNFITLILLLISAFHLFHHVLLICILLTLRQVWKAHQVQLLQPGLQFELGVSLYCAMKRFLNQVNALIATPMLIIYITNLTYFANTPDILTIKLLNSVETAIEKVNMVFYSVYTVLIWTLSSQIHAEIQGAMKLWVYEFHTNGKRIISLEDRMKLISLTNQVESDNLGVSLGAFFTVTYNTFGSMFGLIVSYSIIVFGLPKTK